MPSTLTPSSILLALLTGANLVSAHGYVASWTIGGTKYQGFNQQWNSAVTDKFIAWTTTASDNGFVAPSAYTSGDIICHRGGSNAKLDNATVAAGGTVTATWNTWPEGHHGPVMDYIAAADDPTTVDKAALKWVKIQEAGLVSGSNPGTWASDTLISQGNSWEIKIPASLKPGKYVLRHEIIALHSAGQADGAQNYPQCMNLEVTGSGSELPDGTAGTALYTPTDAGILFNLYTSFSSYKIPGPALAFSGNSADNGSGSGSGSSSSSGLGSASSAAPVVASSAAASTSVASTAPATVATTNTTPAAVTPKPSHKCKSRRRRHARDVAQKL